YVGRGTFVSQHIPQHKPNILKPEVIRPAWEEAGFAVHSRPYLNAPLRIASTRLHLDDGFPDPRLAPVADLYRAYRNQLSRGELYTKFGSYSHPSGSEPYREAISRHINETRGLNSTLKNILSVRGTLMGLNLVCNGLIEPGDVIVSGAPGWNRAEMNFIHAKAEHITIAVDQNGLVVQELKKICSRKRVRMVYVTPHHHYPTTAPMRIDRRLELLQLAEEYGFIIFEDDYDFDFHYQHRPLLPLASADGNRMVIYCGSFSKSFSPAFRMGYLVAAENVIEHLSKVRILLDRQEDHILDNAMADLLTDGTIQRYLRKTLNIYRERRDFFCDLLHNELKGAVSFTVPDGGMAIWTEFEKDIDLSTLAKKAGLKGLYISDGSVYQYPDDRSNAVRLGFASSAQEDLAQSIEIIKGLI
ncbi:MAG: PLP-dependent aminotransferase family protein, partial [Pedobacter sp.]